MSAREDINEASKAIVAAMLALAAAVAYGSLGIAKTSTSPAVAATQRAVANASEPGSLRPPKVIKLFYSRSSEGHSVEAYARRADSLRFATRYRGMRASAPGRLEDELNGRQEWEPIRGRGKRIKGLVRRALQQRGVAKVRTRAKGDGLVDDHWWRIVLAECSQNPPLYPVDCVIERSGKR